MRHNACRGLWLLPFLRASCTKSHVVVLSDDAGPSDGAAPDGAGLDAASDGDAGDGETGTDYNRVFVSSESFSMALGSAEAYDLGCNRLATAAGINNGADDAYIAWISSNSSDAASRLGGARGFVRMDGLPFADELTTGEVFRAVELDENGVKLPPGASVATGTTMDGTVSSNNCSDWSGGPGGLTLGDTDGGPRRWTVSGGGNCSFPQRVYCVETTQRRELVPVPVDGRLLFLTNEDYVGVGTPDDVCIASKPAASGDVVALVSTNSLAAGDLLAAGENYVRPDGTLVATGSELQAGTWQTGAWQQGDGVYPQGNLRVWTGSETIERLGDLTCADWTTVDRDVDGRFGLPQTPDAGSFWGSGRNRQCSSSGMRFYCVETGS